MNDAGRRASRMTHLQVLIRRRDWLEQLIMRDQPQPSAWDKRELKALTWAIAELEKQEKGKGK